MKKIVPFLLLLFMFFSCKKDAVDSSSIKAFQESINDMTSSLNTLQQVKFNEALYILKTFGVEGDGDTYELKALAKLLEGKKVPEILAMADRVAQQNGIAWTSNGPPSLGEMNIFASENPQEADHNDIVADGLDLITKPVAIDSVLGPKSLQVLPRLVNRTGQPVAFDGAALETVMEVYSNGNKLLTSKNLMQNNNFPGFTIRFSSLSPNQITDGKIDVKVSVKTTKKTYKMSKIGIPVNTNFLKKPEPAAPTPGTESTAETPEEIKNNSTAAELPNAGDPKTTVQKFLNHVSTKNLKAAYETSENPNWGSYDHFANPTSGFGSVKNLSVNSITTNNSSNNSASVSATYDVTDKNGNTSTVKANFGLKNINGTWKINSYKLN